MIRTTFDMRLSGELNEISQAMDRIGDELLDAGFYFDEDWTFLHGDEMPGLQFRRLASLRAALDLLSPLGIYMVETDREKI